MRSTQLSPFAAVNKKPSKVPVFLIYAGIVHAIGLALLLPMLITLPGPGSEIAPKTSAVDVEIAPASLSAAKVEQDADQTSALPSAQPSAAKEAPVGAPPEAGGAEARAKPEADAPSAVANVGPEAQPEEEPGSTPVDEEPSEAVPPAKEKTKAEAAKPAKAAVGAAKKKPSAQRNRTAKPVRRSAKTKSTITPFNGALSGLFSPGAPANRRR